jgi:hypothetical protein
MVCCAGDEVGRELVKEDVRLAVVSSVVWCWPSGRVIVPFSLSGMEVLSLASCTVLLAGTEDTDEGPGALEMGYEEYPL